MDDKLTAALVALSAATIAAFANLYWNFRSATAARKQPFLLKQLEFCFETSECVALLATTSDVAKWEAARDRFWHLYYGALAVVEGRDLEERMVECSRLIPPTGPAPNLPVSELSDCALAVSQSVRALLVDAWDIRSIEQSLEGRSGIFEAARQAYRTEFERQMSGHK